MEKETQKNRGCGATSHSNYAKPVRAAAPGPLDFLGVRFIPLVKYLVSASSRPFSMSLVKTQHVLDNKAVVLNFLQHHQEASEEAHIELECLVSFRLESVAVTD